MNERVEELAEDLFNMYHKTYGNTWITLAKHALRREIEARIEENARRLSYYHGDSNLACFMQRKEEQDKLEKIFEYRIKILQSQLEEIK